MLTYCDHATLYVFSIYKLRITRLSQSNFAFSVFFSRLVWSFSFYNRRFQFSFSMFFFIFRSTPNKTGSNESVHLHNSYFLKLTKHAIFNFTDCFFGKIKEKSFNFWSKQKKWVVLLRLYKTIHIWPGTHCNAYVHYTNVIDIFLCKMINVMSSYCIFMIIIL